MKRGLIALVIALFAVAARAADRPLSLTVHQSFALRMIGATAMWAVDPSIVDAEAIDGQITLYGRSAGRTKVVVIVLGREQTFDVTVSDKNAPAPVAQRSRDAGVAEARSSSGQRE